MCGISGIINFRQKSFPTEKLKEMTKKVSHRGPDDSNIYINEQLGFGHTRLSVLDLSKRGSQPLTYMNRYTITYNGEIYNYIELKNKLKKEGYKFKSQTDTEVILAAYDFWNEKCVLKFNGMWSFAIYDKKKTNCFFIKRSFWDQASILLLF